MSGSVDSEKMCSTILFSGIANKGRRRDEGILLRVTEKCGILSVHLAERKKQSFVKTELHCGKLEAEVFYLFFFSGSRRWKDPVDAADTGGVYGQEKKKIRKEKKIGHSVLKSHMHANKSNSQHNGVPLQAKDTEKGRFQAIYSNCRSRAVSSLYPGGVTERQHAFLPLLSLSRVTADWTTWGRSNAKQRDEAGCQLHLFSMSICTLCTSSRAILRMCWTSCLSAISIKTQQKSYIFIYIYEYIDTDSLMQSLKTLLRGNTE